MKKRFFPKGRLADPSHCEKIAQLLGPTAQQRDMLIENLHMVQDTFGHLDKESLSALAEVMRLSQAQVYEVASFYAHFHLNGPPAPQQSCVSLPCAMFGAGHGTPVPCVGRCADAPVSLPHTHKTPTDYIDYAAYDYVIYRQYKGRPDQVLHTLEAANLRGLGGAGFKVADKWRFFDKAANAVLVINADEGEPGTFKDRHCLETNPHKVIEGALIAADVINAKDIYIYLRDEYADIRHILQTELPKIDTDGRVLHLRRGAGAYICGEETALLESLEGKRGLPRIKPPYPAQQGLFGRPTLINNVETLWRVQDILQNGIEAGSKRFFSLSGRIKKPGVYEAPLSITAHELITQYGGGLLDGHKFKAYLPGGASGGILPAHLANLPLGFGQLEQYGCFIGSAAVIVLSDHDNMKTVCKNLLDFFNHESCGQCTPCRVGCDKLSNMLRHDLDMDLAQELCAVMRDSSICGLGQAAPNPLLSALTYFAEDFA